MPYGRVVELPESVRDNIPQHAQEIYKEAYNSAWDRYDSPNERRGNASREETSRRVAWSAVKKEYTKQNGKWVRKDD
jgi:cation transport regulator